MPFSFAVMNVEKVSRKASPAHNAYICGRSPGVHSSPPGPASLLWGSVHRFQPHLGGCWGCLPMPSLTFVGKSWVWVPGCPEAFSWFQERSPVWPLCSALESWPPDCQWCLRAAGRSAPGSSSSALNAWGDHCRRRSVAGRSRARPEHLQGCRSKQERMAVKDPGPPGPPSVHPGSCTA